ncbi:MAG: hypothetical protein WBV55_13995 [Candidatus Sulfotelmatobacter sp.]
MIAKSVANTEPSKSREIEGDILLHGRMTLRMALLMRISSYLSGRLTLTGVIAAAVNPGRACLARAFRSRYCKERAELDD